MSDTPQEPDPKSSSYFPSSVEFTCAYCGKPVQLSAETVGRQLRCPYCGVVQVAPDHSPPSPPKTFETTGGRADVQPRAPNASTDGVVSHHSDSTIIAAEAANANSSPPDSISPETQPLRDATPVVTPADSSISPIATASGHKETATKRLFDRIINEISEIYVGQDELVLGTLVALFSGGHILIESVPGLGKTLFVRTLGQVLGCRFGRMQFTADLMPSDITGAPIFDMKTQEFRFRPGPVFTQLLLADEINRSPAKTHAALLEIMQEYRVTIDGTSHPIERPFLVMATQNPIESEGTYNLPEAQLDRFMFKLVATYPNAEEEAAILTLHSQQMDINQRLSNDLKTVTSPEEIVRVTAQNSAVHVDEKLLNYINQIVRKTREWPQFYMGASPRAGIALMQGIRTLAAFHGRDYSVPDDVAQIALPALRHRTILTAEAEVEGHSVDQLLHELIRSVEVPRI